MLAVALLPLAALTALVGADLTQVNQTTVDEAHSTMVTDATQREAGAVVDGSSTIEARLDSLDAELGQLAATVDTLLRTSTSVIQPVLTTAGGAHLLEGAGLPGATLIGSQSRAVTAGAGYADPFGANRAEIAAALDTVRRHHPELSAVWLYDSAAAELTEVPVTDPQVIATLLENNRIDPVHLLDRQLQAALHTTDPSAAGATTGRAQAPRTPAGPSWSDIDTAAFESGSSVTVWTGMANPNYYIGAEVPTAGFAGLLPSTVSTLPDAYTVLLSSTGRWMSAGSGATADFSLGDGFQGTPVSASGISPSTLATLRPQVLQARLGGTLKDVFTAPVDPVHWTLASVVPDRDIAPAALALGDGLRSAVHRILILQVLPLAVVLGAIAVVLASLFSRRLVGPVRELTLSAERLAQGHIDEPVPRQGEDEVGLLSEALERMRAEISTSRRALLSAARELEGRVADRTAELRDRNEELVALNALGGTLTRSLDPRDLLDGAVAAVRAILPVVAVAGYTVVDGAPRLMASLPDPLGDAAGDLAAAAAAALELGRVDERGLGRDALIAVPVVTAGQPLGALVARVRSATALPERTRTLLGAIADQLGLALRTAQLSAEGRELAVLEERTRLAREIHDTLAQQLTGIVLQLEAAATLQSRHHDERSHDLVVAAREQARLALQEARRSVWNLRPVPLEAAGLASAVALEAERFTVRTGIEVGVRNRRVPVDLALPPQSEVAVFRIVQEALANAGRHSRAGRVEVELRAVGDELRLTVRDDGDGFDVDGDDIRTGGSRGFGLVGMRERAELIGAQFEVRSDPAGGTMVSLRVPLERQAALAEIRP